MVRCLGPLQTDHMAEELWCISPNKGETFQFSPCLLFFKIEMPYFTGHKFTYHKIHHLREHNSVILIWNQRFDRLKAKQALHQGFHVCSGPQSGLQGHVSSGTIELGFSRKCHVQKLCPWGGTPEFCPETNQGCSSVSKWLSSSG